MELLTLNDLDLEDKKVLVRIDINLPIEPKSGEILDDARIRSHIPTIQRLSSSKVVLLAHQSRPGKKDFTTLEKHAERMSRILGKEVRYVDDVFGSRAREAIEKMKNGDVLMLENVRFCAEEFGEEVVSKPPAEQAKTNLVRKLSSYVDFFVNDAFAVSHRSQPSVVGFPIVLPSCIGLEMEKEIRTLSTVLDSKERPKIFCLGGAKSTDSVKIIKNVLSKNIADKVLLSGVISMIFLQASGTEIGEVNKKFVSEQGFDKLVVEAGGILKEHKEKIVLPVDLAFQKDGRREEREVKTFPNERILDIGEKTIKAFKDEIKKAKIIVANGPCGVFEISGFEKGTMEMLRAISGSSSLSVIGGGHLSTVAEKNGFKKKITHVSAGGGACVAFLAGEELPGIEVMKKYARAPSAKL